MYDVILRELGKRTKPIDVIMVGLGFMGFGFLSSIRKTPGIRVTVVISRRPVDAAKELTDAGFEVSDTLVEGKICVSDDLTLIDSAPATVVMEVTGTVDYGTDIALRAIAARKHIVTMNPELQATVGSQLKVLADKAGVFITDVIGDQPGSLARLITQARLMGFTIKLAGNMKRYMNKHATQAEMAAWANDKGLSPRQTVSFTDGTKQSLEMTLVANHFGMDILEFGMRGHMAEEVQDALALFPWHRIPENGVVDYVIGKKLFPGVFVIGEHTDPNQQKYLRYLGLGEGPRYLLFEPYHLCHLEVAGTIANLVLFGQETINNGTTPRATTIAIAKRDLVPGDMIDGIGGDMVYGSIDKMTSAANYLPVGVAKGAKVKSHIHQDEPIKLIDVDVPVNAATTLLGLVKNKPGTQSVIHS